MYLKGVSVKRLIPFVIVSIIYLILMKYSNVPLWADPILPDGWEAQTSLGFFYTLGLFLLLLRLYAKLKESKLKQYIIHVGTISWEVFLIQMVLIGSGVLNVISSTLFDSSYLQILIKVIMALSLSLFLADLYKKFLSIVTRIR